MCLCVCVRARALGSQQSQMYMHARVKAARRMTLGHMPGSRKILTEAQQPLQMLQSPGFLFSALVSVHPFATAAAPVWCIGVRGGGERRGEREREGRGVSIHKYHPFQLRLECNHRLSYLSLFCQVCCIESISDILWTKVQCSSIVRSITLSEVSIYCFSSTLSYCFSSTLYYCFFIYVADILFLYWNIFISTKPGQCEMNYHQIKDNLEEKLRRVELKGDHLMTTEIFLLHSD